MTTQCDWRLVHTARHMQHLFHITCAWMNDSMVIFTNSYRYQGPTYCACVLVVGDLFYQFDHREGEGRENDDICLDVLRSIATGYLFDDEQPIPYDMIAIQFSPFVFTFCLLFFSSFFRFSRFSIRVFVNIKKQRHTWRYVADNRKIMGKDTKRKTYVHLTEDWRLSEEER